MVPIALPWNYWMTPESTFVSVSWINVSALVEPVYSFFFLFIFYFFFLEYEYFSNFYLFFSNYFLIIFFLFLYKKCNGIFTVFKEYYSILLAQSCFINQMINFSVSVLNTRYININLRYKVKRISFFLHKYQFYITSYIMIYIPLSHQILSYIYQSHFEIIFIYIWYYIISVLFLV